MQQYERNLYEICTKCTTNMIEIGNMNEILTKYERNMHEMWMNYEQNMPEYA